MNGSSPGGWKYFSDGSQYSDLVTPPKPPGHPEWVPNSDSTNIEQYPFPSNEIKENPLVEVEPPKTLSKALKSMESIFDLFNLLFEDPLLFLNPFKWF